jgi:hypothetical protein
MKCFNINESGTGSKSSSTVSINKAGREANGNRMGTPTTVRRSTANIDSRTTSSAPRTVPSRAFGASTGSLRTATATSSKENLSRSSSSTSNSVSANDISRISTASTSSPNKTATATLMMSNTRPRPSSSPVKARGQTASSTLSFMKPTASSVKKLSANILASEATGSPAVGRRVLGSARLSTPVISARSTTRR